MKKIIGLLIVGMFLLSFASATTWTRSIDYNEEDIRQVSFKNWWGLGSTQGTMTLVSHDLDSQGNIITKKVGTGWQVTMEYDFEFNAVLNDVLGEVELIDMNTGQYIDREWKYVYWVEEEKERQVCSEYTLVNTNNGTNKECINYVSETYNQGEWKDYVGKNIMAKGVRIGIMVNNQEGDYIDGIWNIGSKKIDKHAVWTASLETDLVSWYKLDEEGVVTNATDSHGSNHGTASNSRVFSTNVTGIINTGADFTGGDDYINTGFSPTTNAVFTWNVWVKDAIGRSIGTATGGSAGVSLDFADGTLGVFSGTSTSARWLGTGTTTSARTTANTLNNGSYHMVTIIRLSNGNGQIYINGNLDLSGSWNPYDSTGNLWIGGNNAGAFGNMIYDEVGIWSRALSSTEVEALYNNGDGLNPDSLALTIELLNPSNDTITYDTEIDFSANVTDEFFLNITNVSLVIDDVIKQTNSSGVEGVYNFTETLDYDEYIWKIIAYDGDDYLYESEERTLNIFSGEIFLEANIVEDYIYYYGDNATLNYTINGQFLDTCWYEYAETTQIIDCNETELNHVDVETIENYSEIILYANNSIGTQESLNLSFNYDEVHPEINLNYPSDFVFYSEINKKITLNISVNDYNPKYIWYDYNGTNIIINNAFEYFSPWEKYENKTYITNGSQHDILEVHYRDSNLFNQVKNYTIPSECRFEDNITIYTIKSNSSLSDDLLCKGESTNHTIGIFEYPSVELRDSLRKTRVLTKTTNYLENITTLNNENKNIIIYANDSIGNLGNETFSWDYKFFLKNFSYEENVLETSEEKFKAEFFVLNESNFFGMKLNYNNKDYNIDEYNTDNNLLTLEKTIDIPLNNNSFSNQTNEFYFVFSDENNNITTETKTQNVSFINFQLCNSTYNINSLNYSIKDEINNSLIIIGTNFQGNVKYWLGDGNIKKNYSFSELDKSQSNFNFCISHNENFRIDFESEYWATNYPKRSYYLSNSIANNISSLQNLFLLEEAKTTKFFFQVFQGIDFVVDSTVNIQKYFITEGLYKTVMQTQTDNLGKFTAMLENDNTYQFSVLKENKLIGTSIKTLSCAAAPCNEEIQLESVKIDLWENYDSKYARNVSTSWNWNPVTEILTINFIDLTGLAEYFRLVVIGGSPSSEVCNKQLYSISGIMNCNLSEYKGDYVAKLYISRSPEKQVSMFSISLKDLAKGLGGLGIFLSFIILITIVFAGRGDPVISLFLIPISLILLKIMQLLNLSWPVISLISMLCIYIASKLRT